MAKSRTPLTVPQMTPVECAWLGAFLEADGNANVYHNRGGSKNTTSLVLRISQSIVNPEPISAALRCTNAGSVSVSNIQYNSEIRPVLQWQVDSRLNAVCLAKQLAPYSPKVKDALDKWLAWDTDGAYIHMKGT